MSMLARCHDGGELLVCDGCPGAFHLLCLQPPIEDVDLLPEGDWFCDICTEQRQMAQPETANLHVMQLESIGKPASEVAKPGAVLL